MKAECGAARRLLRDRSAVRGVDDTYLSAERHARGCLRCQRFVAQCEADIQALRGALNVAAPAAFRASLFEAIAGARGGHPRKRRFSYAAAVIAASFGGLLLGYAFGDRPRADSIVASVAADHALATSDDRLESANANEIERWLGARVSYSVMVPALKGARVIGARTCMTPQGRGAVVEYEIDGRRVSYFILASPPGDVQDRGVGVAAERGYAIAHWRDRGLVHAFVASLPARRVKALAHECIAQAQSFRAAVAGPRELSFQS